VVISGEKYFKSSATVTVDIVPFNGNNPNERMALSNFSNVGAAKLSSSSATAQFAGYFWSENPVGQAEVVIEVTKTSDVGAAIPSFDIADFPAAGGPFNIDFENGISNWGASGMWHATSSGIPAGKSGSGSSSMWYGQDATGNFDNGATNYGWLVSPYVSIARTSILQFSSWSNIETEAPLNYDFRLVEISTDKGATWTEIWRETGNNKDKEWYNVSINLGVYAGATGATARFRFLFNTRDALYNDLGGWYIDDITVGTPPAQAKISAGAMTAPVFRKFGRMELSLEALLKRGK
jgi:hypothetical protein